MSSREPMYSLRECPIKPVDGKMRQGIIHWQSDYSIVSRKSVKSDGEKGIKEYNLLPEPKICHLTYTLSSYRGSITEEPNLGNLDIRLCEGH